jgi:hypothetical protein
MLNESEKKPELDFGPAELKFGTVAVFEDSPHIKRVILVPHSKDTCETTQIIEVDGKEQLAGIGTTAFRAHVVGQWDNERVLEGLVRYFGENMRDMLCQQVEEWAKAGPVIYNGDDLETRKRKIGERLTGLSSSKE